MLLFSAAQILQHPAAPHRMLLHLWGSWPLCADDSCGNLQFAFACYEYAVLSMAQFSMQPACACLPGTAASCMCLDPRRHQFWSLEWHFCERLAVYNHKHLDNQLLVQYPGKSGFAFNHSRNQGLPG